MHNTCLDAVISLYKQKFQVRGLALKNVIVWSDNAPHQYRCRQTFIKVASVMLRHKDISIIHRLAVVDNFKGIHDAVGKVPAHKIRSLELEGVRSPTALDVFKNCHRELSRDESKWKKFEEEGDARLENKGRFGTDSLRCWFVTESKDQLHKLSNTYPNQILHCDRSCIQDTVNQKAIDQTTTLHEVRSIAVEEPESYEGVILSRKDKPDIKGKIREWPVNVSCLPCPCNFYAVLIQQINSASSQHGDDQRM